MRLMLVIAAAAVVVAVNLSGWVAAQRNRTSRPGGTLQLTEHELRLAPKIGDSTAVFLDLEWDVEGGETDFRRSPAWLDETKLKALGFDCRVAPTDPLARDHYRAAPSIPAYVVLELAGAAWEKAKLDPSRKINPAAHTRLFAVDAGLDPRQLRQAYSDPGRYAVVRALVRVDWQDRDRPDAAPWSVPRVRGWVTTVLPSRVFVPRPGGQLLQGLRASLDGGQTPRDRPSRYTVRLSWGEHYEPWVEEVRLTSDGAPKSE